MFSSFIGQVLTLTWEAIAAITAVLAFVGIQVKWLSSILSKKANKKDVSEKFASMDKAMSMTQHEVECIEQRSIKRVDDLKDTINEKLDLILSFIQKKK